MTKIYTKTGDDGTTSFNNKRVEKDSCLIETTGALDELMSSMDKVIYGLGILPKMEDDAFYLSDVQNILRYLGGEISGKEIGFKMRQEDIDYMELLIDNFEIVVTEFQRFHNPIAMDIDEARVRTRKLERLLTEAMRENRLSDLNYAFINRLSDYLFTLAMHIDKQFGDD